MNLKFYQKNRRSSAVSVLTSERKRTTRWRLQAVPLLLFMLLCTFQLAAQVDYFDVRGGWSGNDANGNAIIKWEIEICADQNGDSGIFVTVPSLEKNENQVGARNEADEDSPADDQVCDGQWNNGTWNMLRPTDYKQTGILVEDADLNPNQCLRYTWITYSKDYDSNGSDYDHYVVANFYSDGFPNNPGYNCNTDHVDCVESNTSTDSKCVDQIDCDDVATNNYEQILGLALEVTEGPTLHIEGYFDFVYSYVACHHGESDYLAGGNLEGGTGENGTIDIAPDDITNILIETDVVNTLQSTGAIVDSVKIESIAKNGTRLMVNPNWNGTTDRNLTLASSFLNPGVKEVMNGGSASQPYCDTINVRVFWRPADVGDMFADPNNLDLDACRNYWHLAAADDYQPANGCQNPGSANVDNCNPPRELSHRGLEPDPEYGDSGNTPTGTCSAAPGEDCTATPVGMCYLTGITLDKNVMSAVPATNGDPNQFDVELEIKVTNTGMVQLKNLDLEDDLVQAFGTATAFEAPMLVGPTIDPTILPSATAAGNGFPSLNAGYNGSSDINLLTGNDGVLDPDSMLRVTMTVRLNYDEYIAAGAIDNDCSATIYADGINEVFDEEATDAEPLNLPKLDLALTLTSDTPKATVGDVVPFEVNVCSQGKEFDVQEFDVQVAIPEGYAFAATQTDPNWTYNAADRTADYTYDATVLTTDPATACASFTIDLEVLPTTDFAEYIVAAEIMRVVTTDGIDRSNQDCDSTPGSATTEEQTTSPTGPGNDDTASTSNTAVGSQDDHDPEYVKIVILDYGDLPDSYGTTLANTGASHEIDSTLYLGTCVDQELNGTPEAMAGAMQGGDDNTSDYIVVGTCANAGDEAGVEFITPLIPGEKATIRVSANNTTGAAAVLQGWIDFDGNGTLDTDEELTGVDFTAGASIPAGGVSTQDLCFNVPADAVYADGNAFIRFRLSENGGLDATGAGLIGEVEDYKRELRKVGNLVWYDLNDDGIQNEAVEQGLNGYEVTLTFAGEDGIAGNADDIAYTVTTAQLDNVDGRYEFCGLIDGKYTLDVALPNGVTQPVDGATNDFQDSEDSGVMFTLVEGTPLPVSENGTGDAPGSVFNDNQDDLSFDFGVVAYDFGDLPNDFAATTDADNGAYHVIDPGKYLGTCVDAETDGTPDARAGFDAPGGDDGAGSGFVQGAACTDDEDGFRVLSSLIPGEEACVEVTSNVDAGTGVLNVWVDFDGNGSLSAGEKVNFTKVDGATPADAVNITAPNGAATQVLCFEVPLDATFEGGETHIRVRLGCENDMPVAGRVVGGEVEDYYLPLAKVGSLFWVDYNANGLQDEPASAGLDSVGVTLTAFGEDGALGTADDVEYETETATVNGVPGIYAFCGLIEGEYKITFDFPAAILTTTNAGAADNDSNGMMDTFTVGRTTDDQPTNENGLSDAGLNGAFPDNRVNLSLDAGMLPLDFGDLPASFGNTDLADDGAIHITSADLYLGMCVDVEVDGAQDNFSGENPSANGDNGTPGLVEFGNCTEPDNDEEGVRFLTPMIPGEEACIEVKHNSTVGNAVLNAWIDYDGDGVFAADGSEAIVFSTADGSAVASQDAPLTGGADVLTTLCFDVPTTANFEGGETHLRFRLSTAGGLSPIGIAADGEVEDYWMPFGKIGNIVWFDEDFEGDQNEAALNGINDFPVELLFAGEDGQLDTPDDILYTQMTSTINGQDGSYYFCGLIDGTYRAQYSVYPNGMISTVFDNTGNDNDDSDADFDFITFTITDGFPLNLPTGENSVNDDFNPDNYPDDQTDFSIDFGFVPAPEVAASFALQGVQRPESGVCGRMNAIYQLCIKNDGELPLENLQAMIDFEAANAFGSAFIGYVGEVEVLRSTAQQNPVLNPAFDATAAAKNFLNGTSGLLNPTEEVCFLLTVELEPGEMNAPSEMKIQSMVTADAVNFNGVAIPDVLAGLPQAGDDDLSDDGTDPCSNNPGFPGDTGGEDDPSILDDCWMVGTAPACNIDLNISLDNDGVVYVTENMILEGEIERCTQANLPFGGYYEVTVKDENTGATFGDSITCAMIGRSLIAEVEHIVSCNPCWGNINIEDKAAPSLDCTPLAVTCADSIPAIGMGVTATDNCGGTATIHLVNERIAANDDVCDGSYTILRTYMASDDMGNVSTDTCTQEITVTRGQISFPLDYQIECADYVPNTGQIDPAITGHPFQGDASACSFSVTYTDQVLATCGTGLKIIRTWNVWDECNNTFVRFGANGEDNVQLINVGDTTPPVIQAVNQTVEANVVGQHPQPCTSTGLIGAPIVTDNCSLDSIQIWTPSGEVRYVYDNDGTLIGGYIPSPGLPLGNHTITYRAIDACGNVAEETVTLTVEDIQVPTVVCDRITSVSLSADGLAVVDALVFDDGSTDNCCIDTYEVRRMTPACGDNTAFGPAVTFCCDDIVNSPIMVEMRVTDCYGNAGSCMVEVIVEDKIAPQCVSQLSTQFIDCDFYFDNLQSPLALGDSILFDLYGDAQFIDNCALNVTYSETVDVDNCGNGRIIRSWSARDNNPNNLAANCSQTIIVTHTSDWVVEFPDDVELTCDNTQNIDLNDPATTGEPTVFFETCELIAATYEDRIFTSVPDACYKIEREWTVINWCIYDANDRNPVRESSELTIVTSLLDVNGDTSPLTYDPAQDLNPTIIGNEAGLGDEASGTPNDHTPESGDLVSNDARTYKDGLNVSNFPNARPDGYITYKQIIKVDDNNSPVLTCNDREFCEESTNCGPVFADLSIEAVDGCATSLDYAYEIDAFYDAATAFEVDFAGTGSNSSIANGAYPIGTHLVRWTVADDCGNASSCSFEFVIKDCKKPTPYCKNGLVIEMMQSGMVATWASDFDAGSFDNCSRDLKFSFSADVLDTGRVYTCLEEGVQDVEIWVTDESGNQDFCRTFVIIQDNMNACGSAVPRPRIAGNARTENGQGVETVEIALNGNQNVLTLADVNGAFSFDNLTAGDYTITPMHDVDHRNGVTTWDLVLIARHILGTELLDSPYKIIAADANRSNNLSASDLLQLRSLILTQSGELANNTSWRFVPTNHVFANAQLPFVPNPGFTAAQPFPEVINLNNLDRDVLDANFVAIKVGDVNNSAATNNAVGLDDRTFNGALKLQVQDQAFAKGDVVEVDVTAADAQILGYQFTLNFATDKLSFVDVEEGVARKENFGTHGAQDGFLTTSWNKHAVEHLTENTVLFTLVFEAQTNGNLSQVLSASGQHTAAEAYGANGELLNVDFVFTDTKTAQKDFVVYQNVPNPFVGTTTIGFDLPKADQVTLVVRDVSGKELHRVSKFVEAGYQAFELELSNASGVLYYTVASSSASETRSMVILKN